MPDAADTTLGDLVVEHPGAAPVFDELGLDYCCQGERTLAAACAEAGIDPAEVATRLEFAPIEPEADWAGLPPAELADHIVATHHHYLRRVLPVIDALAEKVWSVHGERHPELGRIRAIVSRLGPELITHLDEEERLFPLIDVLGSPDADAAATDSLRSFAADHDAVGAMLAELRDSSAGFDPPADACASYTSLYRQLAEIEADTHRHVHKENHVLFPAIDQLTAA